MYWEKHREPWRMYGVNDRFRYSLDGEYCKGRVCREYIGDEGLWTYWFFDLALNEKSRVEHKPFTTIEEAMVACDKVLIECGYTLFSKERSEKLQVLV